ncbi:hypothetical protein ATK36_0479 [Amycolatopsis sulphurea]|uniref:DUF2637 domain-containing protein n=1 Tax=Amycolatopsis sulphurea TaxID=76022 RepID=A0A2A9G1A2_9PSEU|nr:hypothetical protein [Amycolatopsis sulphurea]PFG56943.1 hypothetical protein ATK36_0479 [Amycolatopsis sulphurea]
MSWNQEIRENKAAKAEQKRLDQAAATGDDIARMHAAGEEARKDREAAATLAATAKATRLAEREKRRTKRAQWWAKVRGAAAAHVVDVLIYAIALVSFAMAAPAMAGYGAEVYASALGGLLPLITELGMWAFAVAVLLSRVRTPARPVWGLQVGVWVFGVVAFAANAVHGLARGWAAGVVMGVVSVAGVIAHQLAIASPPRSRTERDAARIQRTASVKAAAAARAAVRHADALIDRDGHARLTYTPGTYRLRRFGGLGRARLIALAPDPDVPGVPDALDAEIQALLDLATPGGTAAEAGEPLHRGTVATVEPPAPGPETDVPAVGGDDTPAGGTGKTRRRPAPKRTTIPEPKRRSFTQLQAEFEQAVRNRPAGFDPTNAESIRRTLECGKKPASELRNGYLTRRGEPGTD